MVRLTSMALLAKEEAPSTLPGLLKRERVSNFMMNSRVRDVKAIRLCSPPGNRKKYLYQHGTSESMVMVEKFGRYHSSIQSLPEPLRVIGKDNSVCARSVGEPNTQLGTGPLMVIRVMWLSLVARLTIQTSHPRLRGNTQEIISNTFA